MLVFGDPLFCFSSDQRFYPALCCSGVCERVTGKNYFLLVFLSSFALPERNMPEKYAKKRKEN